MTPLEIGVCTWSIDRDDPSAGMQLAADRLAIRTVQIGAFGAGALHEFDVAAIAKLADQLGVAIAALFVGFDDVDTSSPTQAAATGGLAHPQFGAARADLLSSAVTKAHEMRVNVLAAHIGPVPEDAAGQRLVLERLAPTLDQLDTNDGTLLLETGAEPADRLNRFLDEANRPSLAINYDPANFLGHDSGDPVRAVTTLALRIQQVHLKDAARKRSSQDAWPEPCSLGAGDVNIPRVISKLRAKGYQGPLFVERPGGHGGIDAVAADVEYLRTMLV